ncbi:MAG: endolytic transglycosylase MltG [Candidatus Moraniibacteriota bacterium]
MNKKILLGLIFIFILLGGIFYFRNQVYYFHSQNNDSVVFEIKKGEGISLIADNLVEKKLISGKIYFYYYLYTNHLLNKIMPETYVLMGNMTIPEIVHSITQEKKEFISVTFPEGLRSDEIANKLNEKGLDGDGFLALVNNPGELVGDYSFLLVDKVKNLEGYLYPDTYFYSKKDTAENIVRKFLDNFEKKVTDDLRSEIKNQKKTIFEIVTMASIVEKEALIDYKKGVDDNDAKIIAGIFWNRIKNLQSLQSCATLGFVFKDPKPKFQYSFEDTRVDSPYNTYINKGLPPGPISNPGILAIRAAIYPTITDYNYFLSDADSNLIFSRTLDEHNANKNKAGL